MSAKIITFEGIDGAGKSTLVKALHDHFTTKGLHVWSTSEPWELTTIDPDPFIATMQLMADRRRHCKAITGTLYDIALIDRFDLSTEAYQGYGDGVDRDLINTLNDIATEGLDVSLRILLDIPVRAAVRRLEKRGESVTADEIARLNRVRAGYIEMAEEGWLISVDATESPEAVLCDAIALIEEVL